MAYMDPMGNDLLSFMKTISRWNIWDHYHYYLFDEYPYQDNARNTNESYTYKTYSTVSH